MAEQRKYKWDIFVSYSHEDKKWVDDELMPRLRRAGLNTRIDDDFEPGKTALLEIEEAILESERTILVLSKNYFNSEWAKFEQIFVQTHSPIDYDQRFLPVLKEECEIPQRLGIIIPVNLTKQENQDREWYRLLRILKAPTHPVGFIGLGKMGEPMARKLLKEGFDLFFASRKKILSIGWLKQEHFMQAHIRSWLNNRNI